MEDFEIWLCSKLERNLKISKILCEGKIAKEFSFRLMKMIQQKSNNQNISFKLAFKNFVLS